MILTAATEMFYNLQHKRKELGKDQTSNLF